MTLQNTRSTNYPEWYQNVITAAEMAELSVSPGCMVIKPWGYGIWERIQRLLDEKIKETGHDNCYFPMFIPLSFFKKEAEHVEGFAKEMAVVTHSKLEKKDGELVPGGELEEPLIVRPTSETIIADSFSRWVKSYRDLPVMINQWANVVRWEMRPRVFLRTREFLWQEGHTAHETVEQAEQEARTMLNVYIDLSENCLAIPVIPGKKPEHEKFAGAIDTYTFEPMMQDGRALQAGTSHNLGKNFAKAANIQFQNKEGKLEYAATASWGVSTRLIGGLIMTHADDEGMVVPPRVAPQQIIIIPLYKNKDKIDAVKAYADNLQAALAKQTAFGEKIRVRVDQRGKESVDKMWEWTRKGAPIVVEVGPRDMEKHSVLVRTRTHIIDENWKEFVDFDAFVASAGNRLENIQREMFDRAKERLDAHVRTDITTPEAFEAYFANQNVFLERTDVPTVGFVRGKWSGDETSLEKMKEMRITIRCCPFDQSGTTGKCLLTGKDATLDVIFARAY